MAGEQFGDVAKVPIDVLNMALSKDKEYFKVATKYCTTSSSSTKPRSILTAKTAYLQARSKVRTRLEREISRMRNEERPDAVRGSISQFDNAPTDLNTLLSSVPRRIRSDDEQHVTDGRCCFALVNRR